MVPIARPLAVLVLGILLTACPKSGDGGKPAPSASSSSASPVASVPAASASAQGAASSAPTGAAATFAGSYSVAPAAIYISKEKEFASVKQVKDDPSKHVGEGTITLKVEPDGRVSGTIDAGPAAPGVIEGTKSGNQISGTVRRKSPSDDGLTGTLLATIAADNVEGRLVLAESNAAIVREGKLSLKKN
jgi:hypothetical protein